MKKIILFILLPIVFLTSVNLVCAHTCMHTVSSDTTISNQVYTCSSPAYAVTGYCLMGNNINIINVSVINCYYGFALGITANSNYNNIRLSNIYVQNGAGAETSRQIQDFSLPSNTNYVEFSNAYGKIVFNGTATTGINMLDSSTGKIGLGYNVKLSSNNIYFKHDDWTADLANSNAHIEFYDMGFVPSANIKIVRKTNNIDYDCNSSSAGAKCVNIQKNG